MTLHPYPLLKEAARQRPPVAALVLGSGLNSIIDEWVLTQSVPFNEIPDLPATTVAGHTGRLCLSEFSAGTVLVFQGRLHYYEGHSWEAVDRPIHLALELGIHHLILTNASGGIGPKQEAGSLMAVRDHIAAIHPDWWRPLAETHVKRASPYSPRLLNVMHQAVADIGMELPEGTYACVTGPNYETRAEVRALQCMGADVVGMSTAHESETAARLGMEVAAISCVGNRAAGLSATPLTHAEVLTVVNRAARKLASLLRAVLGRLAD